MTWVRTDDRAPHHPKMLRVSIAAFGFWTSAKCWASDHLTNGFVPIEALGPSIYPTISRARAVKFAEELAEANDPSRPGSKPLFEPVQGGWLIHDYLEYNPSADQVQAEREATKRRVKDWKERKRLERAGRGNAPGNAEVTPLLHRSGNAGNASGNAPVTLPPSPSPSPSPSPKNIAPTPGSSVGDQSDQLRGALLTQSVAGSLNGEDDEADAIIAHSMKITIAEVRRRRAAIGAQP